MILVVVSTGHFDPLIQECDRLSSTFSCKFFGQIGMGHYVPQHFPYVRTVSPTELENKMQEAELVISHGGTGMLSMLYRMKKPTIVIPKQMRYGEANDSQVELAVKWGALGMALLCMDVRDLEDSIHQAYRTRFVFPTFPSLGQSLTKTLGAPFMTSMSLAG